MLNCFDGAAAQMLRPFLRRILLRRGWAVAGLCAVAQVHAVDVVFKPVAPDVYAFVGETGARSLGNEGLNANIGLVVTATGALLIDSGATAQGARQIAEAVRRITPQPVRWVINTGGQDHRWLGNGFFSQQGAELIAHAAALPDMQQRGGDHLAALKAVLGPLADGTQATLPTRLVAGRDERITLGGVVLELRHRGGGHTPGDMMVWLPQQGVLFAGDIVYTQRMLGVIPVSHTGRWLEAFAAIENLKPSLIVPGHGPVSDLARARADTASYLKALRAHMKKAVNDGVDVSAAVKAFDSRPFLHLLNAAELMPGNASRTYLEVERE